MATYQGEYGGALQPLSGCSAPSEWLQRKRRTKGPGKTMNEEKVKRVEQIQQHLRTRAVHTGCCLAQRDALVAICDLLKSMLVGEQSPVIAGPVAKTEEVELVFWRMRMGRDPVTGEDIDQYCDSRYAADNAPCMQRAGHGNGHIGPDGYLWF